MKDGTRTRTGAPLEKSDKSDVCAAVSDPIEQSVTINSFRAVDLL